jgi:hypothetical protein
MSPGIDRYSLDRRKQQHSLRTSDIEREPFIIAWAFFLPYKDYLIKIIKSRTFFFPIQHVYDYT